MFYFLLRCQPCLRQSALVTAFFFATPALLQAAEPTPMALSLADAQRLAIARSSQLVAQDAAARAAREMAVSAGQLPDPVLKLGVDNLPVTGPDRLSLGRDFMTMRRIGLAQELPRSDKRQLKAERFERDAERAEAQRQLALAALQQGTALSWLERYYALAMRQLLEQQLGETRLQAQSAELAFREGRGPQADIFAARAAQLEIEDRLSQIDRQATSAALMLARWVGTDAARPPQGHPDWTRLWGTADVSAPSFEQLRQHPRLAVSAAAVHAAETDARLAQANTRPDWTVEAAYQQRGSSFSNMVSIGVSIPLQWDQKSRQNREIGAKLAALEEARATDTDNVQAYEAEVRGLLNDWQSGKQRVARYTSQMIPVAAQRTEAALTAYRSGKGDLAGVLSARRDDINTRIQALAVELETARAWAQLNYLQPDKSTATTAVVAAPFTAKVQP